MDFLHYSTHLLLGTFDLLLVLLATLIFSDLFQLSDLPQEQFVVEFDLSDFSLDLGDSLVHVVLLHAEPQPETVVSEDKTLIVHLRDLHKVADRVIHPAFALAHPVPVMHRLVLAWVQRVVKHFKLHFDLFSFVFETVETLAVDAGECVILWVFFVVDRVKDHLVDATIDHNHGRLAILVFSDFLTEILDR